MGEAKPCGGCGTAIYYEGLCWRCRARQGYQAYIAMTQEEEEQAVEEIVNNILAMDANDDSWEAADNALTGFDQLFAYRNCNTERLAQAAFSKEVFDPPTLYRDASGTVRDGLLEQLRQPDCEDPGSIQCCLAMIGGRKVEQAFLELEKAPLPWRKELEADPSTYAEYGGWSFDRQGRVRRLVFDDCYRMTPGLPEEAGPIRLAVPRNDNCPHCGCSMMDVMIIDGSDSRLAFLGLQGEVRLPLCPNCALCADHNYIRYSPGGQGSYERQGDYFPSNQMEQSDLAEMAGNAYVLEPNRATPFAALGSYELPTIGGYPSWIQDWIYEPCPDCGQKMRYFATIPWDCLVDGMEGSLYLEICTGCRTVAAVHQQA